jgi:mannose-1-phosphate guanylyltransferase/phosphomannomutase
MLDVGGVPLIERVLENMCAHGIVEVAINLHFRGDQVRRHLGDGADFGLAITYFEELSLLGTAGALVPMAGFLGGDPFLLHYGDVLTDQDLGILMRAHQETGGNTTLLLHQRPGSNSAVDVDAQGRVHAFVERPAAPPPAPSGGHRRLVFSGVAVLDPEVLSALQRPPPLDLPRDLFVPRVAQGRTHGVSLTGYRCAIDSEARLAEARSAVADGRYRVRRSTGARA